MKKTHYFGAALITLIIFIITYSIIYKFYHAKNENHTKIKLEYSNSLLDIINKKTSSKSISSFNIIPDTILSKKSKNLFLFYIPSNICLACFDEFYQNIRMIEKNRMVILIDRAPEQALISLLKYNKLMEVVVYDKLNIFLQNIIKTMAIKKPIGFTVKNDIIKNIFYLDKEITPYIDNMQ